MVRPRSPCQHGGGQPCPRTRRSHVTGEGWPWLRSGATEASQGAGRTEALPPGRQLPVGHLQLRAALAAPHPVGRRETPLTPRVLPRLPRLLGGVRQERLSAHRHAQQHDARVQDPRAVIPHHLHHRRGRAHRGGRRRGELVHHLLRRAPRSVGAPQCLRPSTQSPDLGGRGPPAFEGGRGRPAGLVGGWAMTGHLPVCRCPLITA